MTVDELRNKFNSQFGLTDSWPSTYEVDAETYANVCDFIFQYKLANECYFPTSGVGFIQISIGPNGGIRFKNVELILSREKK